MMQDESLPSLLEFARELAWQAGRLTLSFFGTGVVPELKADQSPVTVADRQAEQRMRALIAERFPGHGVLGEEYGESGQDADYRWILDPIDGTKSFVQSVPLYGVLVGLERRGEPVLGVCYFPALGEMVAAAQGLGCSLNGRTVRVSDVSSLEQAVLLSSDAESFAAYGRDAVYNDLRSRVRFARTWGDCYGHVLVATGRAEVMLDPIMNVWDCAALLPIVQEAGGHFTDWRGRATIHGDEAISTNAALHATVIEATRG